METRAESSVSQPSACTEHLLYTGAAQTLPYNRLAGGVLWIVNINSFSLM